MRPRPARKSAVGGLKKSPLRGGEGAGRRVAALGVVGMPASRRPARGVWCVASPLSGGAEAKAPRGLHPEQDRQTLIAIKFTP